MFPEKIISGGQTGADRGALDFAIDIGLPHGGFAPKGRVAEDGVIDQRYGITEMASKGYPARTRKNIETGDATLIFTDGGKLGRGTKLTLRLCKELGKPHLVVDLHAADTSTRITDWLRDHTFSVLNVAGPRESQCPGASEGVFNQLAAVFNRIGQKR